MGASGPSGAGAQPGPPEERVPLRQHGMVLRGERVILRPLTEGDWSHLLRWNNDPEVLYGSEGDDVSGYGLSQLQQIYRSVCQAAFCFIIEADGAPVGECWLQRMNLERILERHPGQDCRRIDLLIGETAYWGRGLGTEVVRLLVGFAFEQEGADRMFACDVAEDNQASLRVFQKVGFQVDAAVEQPPGAKVRVRFDLDLPRDRWAAGVGRPIA
jgi:RimJ/RimL family protein N-acetyltransferase